MDHPVEQTQPTNEETEVQRRFAICLRQFEHRTGLEIGALTVNSWCCTVYMNTTGPRPLLCILPSSQRMTRRVEMARQRWLKHWQWMTVSQ